MKPLTPFCNNQELEPNLLSNHKIYHAISFSRPEKIPNDKEDYVERESTRLQEQ